LFHLGFPDFFELESQRHSFFLRFHLTRRFSVTLSEVDVEHSVI